VLVSFSLRFLVAASGFWILDSQGTKVLAASAAVFFSGLTVPLVLFPGWLQDVAVVLPWATFLQIPADIWLGQRGGVGILTGLGLQVFWAVALLAVCAFVLRTAERKVVVQGG
jgi:ABC-2 type transport system permease protein